MECFQVKTVKWFHSYLTNRVLFFPLNNVFLETRTINLAVLQSVLGPLLFLNENYIAKALPNSHTYLYADGTSIFYLYQDVTKIGNVLNRNLHISGNGLLIINYQFILVKIKLHLFSAVG